LANISNCKIGEGDYAKPEKQKAPPKPAALSYKL